MRFLLLVLAASFPAGCMSAAPMPEPIADRLESRPVADPVDAFPRLREGADGDEMQALGYGRLALEEGCLRLVTSGDSRLIVWPASASPSADGAAVVDRSTGNGARVGEAIIVPGGEVSGFDPAALDAPVPRRCAGPYWIAGRGFFKAPEESWRTTRMSGPYSAQLPSGMRRVDARGIDSIVDVFETPTLRLTFDYGAMACGVSSSAQTPGHAVSTTFVDQREVEIDRYSDTAEDGRPVYRLEARMNGIDRPRRSAPSAPSRACLTVFAECASAGDCDVARSIVSTIAVGPVTRDEAIGRILAEQPELADDRNSALPPRRIETERSPAGDWRVAFIRSGSGVASILDAICFRVSRFGDVESSGLFRRPANADVRRLDLATCAPKAG